MSILRREMDYAALARNYLDRLRMVSGVSQTPSHSLSTILSRPLDVRISIQVFQNCKTVRDFNSIMFLNLHFVYLLEIEYLHITFVCCSFTY
jgi:hypothetical protein